MRQRGYTQVATFSNHAALAAVLSPTIVALHAASRSTVRAASRSRGILRADIQAVSASQRESLQVRRLTVVPVGWPPRRYHSVHHPQSPSSCCIQDF